MKVIEDVQDKYGNYCIIFKSTNLRLISSGKVQIAETVVYFLDAITEEVLDYAGFKLANTDET